MASALKAEDLMPLIQHLSARERARLARQLLHVAPNKNTGDAARYQSTPLHADEFGDLSAADPLGWDGEGWSEFDEAR
jgi:hypothetical protein